MIERLDAGRLWRNGAAQKSNLPSGGLHDRTLFEHNQRQVRQLVATKPVCSEHDRERVQSAERELVREQLCADGSRFH